MKATINTRNCVECGHPLRGRTDKRFCDDTCRNHHNNALRAREDIIIKDINKILKMNRRILQSLVPDDAESASSSTRQLQFMGFHFNYFTHSQIKENGETFFFCYDFGYLILDQGKVLVVKNIADPFAETGSPVLINSNFI
jgi:predicted nucleic acid-binding Zn ribbon protein